MDNSLIYDIPVGTIRMRMEIGTHKVTGERVYIIKFGQGDQVLKPGEHISEEVKKTEKKDWLFGLVLRDPQQAFAISHNFIRMADMMETDIEEKRNVDETETEFDGNESMPLVW